MANIPIFVWAIPIGVLLIALGASSIFMWREASRGMFK